MHHRASRLHAVAALLLALGALGTVAGVASLGSSASNPYAVTSRAHERTGVRREAFASRAPAAAAAKSGPYAPGVHVDLAGALAAVAVGALLLLGRLVAGRAGRLLPRLAAAPLGARAPPALV
jgi:hypothetical protein